jgi:hypothetical protein
VVDGLLEGSFGITRTTDGRLWIAWVEQHWDLTWHYTQDCGQYENTECYCNAQLLEDLSTATLHLAHHDPDENLPIEVLELPIPALQAGGFSGFPDNARMVDVRAHDDQVAIGLRLTDGDAPSTAARLLQVDTSAL